MALSSIDSTSRTSPLSHSDDSSDVDRSKKQGPKEPDFSGPAYAAVHLPVMGAGATKATVAKDVADVKAKLEQLAKDFQKPEWQELAKAAGKTGIAWMDVMKTLRVLTFEVSELAGGDLKAIPSVALDVVHLGFEVHELIENAKKLSEANTPEAREQLLALAHDVKQVEEAGAKLGSDARKALIGF